MSQFCKAVTGTLKPCTQAGANPPVVGGCCGFCGQHVNVSLSCATVVKEIIDLVRKADPALADEIRRQYL